MNTKKYVVCCCILLPLLLFFSCDNDVPLDDLLELQRDMIPVETEAELTAAIANAPSGSIIGIVGNLNVQLGATININKTLTIVSFSGTTTISRSGNINIFFIGPPGSLTLGDPRIKGKLILDGNAMSQQIVNVNGGSGSGGRLTMYEGVVIQNGGGGVNVANYSTFTMFGGTISGNPGAYAGVSVASDSIFTMYGGTISGNLGGGNGGGVACGAFTMYGGTISGNAASAGGGVYILANGTFDMFGGTISGNTATTGGGVFANGGTVTMYGGFIYGTDGLSYSPAGKQNTATSAAAALRKQNTAYFTYGGNYAAQYGTPPVVNDFNLTQPQYFP